MEPGVQSQRIIDTLEAKKHSLLVEIGALVRLRCLLEDAVGAPDDAAKTSPKKIVLECTALMQQVLENCALAFDFKKASTLANRLVFETPIRRPQKHLRRGEIDTGDDVDSDTDYPLNTPWIDPTDPFLNFSEDESSTNPNSNTLKNTAKDPDSVSKVAVQFHTPLQYVGWISPPASTSSSLDQTNGPAPGSFHTPQRDVVSVNEEDPATSRFEHQSSDKKEEDVTTSNVGRRNVLSEIQNKFSASLEDKKSMPIVKTPETTAQLQVAASLPLQSMVTSGVDPEAAINGPDPVGLQAANQQARPPLLRDENDEFKGVCPPSFTLTSPRGTTSLLRASSLPLSTALARELTEEGRGQAAVVSKNEFPVHQSFPDSEKDFISGTMHSPETVALDFTNAEALSRHSQEVKQSPTDRDDVPGCFVSKDPQVQHSPKKSTPPELHFHSRELNKKKQKTPPSTVGPPAAVGYITRKRQQLQQAVMETMEAFQSSSFERVLGELAPRAPLSADGDASDAGPTRSPAITPIKPKQQKQTQSTRSPLRLSAPPESNLPKYKAPASQMSGVSTARKGSSSHPNTSLLPTPTRTSRIPRTPSRIPSVSPLRKTLKHPLDRTVKKTTAKGSETKSSRPHTPQHQSIGSFSQPKTPGSSMAKPASTGKRRSTPIAKGSGNKKRIASGSKSVRSTPLTKRTQTPTSQSRQKTPLVGNQLPGANVNVLKSNGSIKPSNTLPKTSYSSSRKRKTSRQKVAPSTAPASLRDRTISASPVWDLSANPEYNDRYGVLNAENFI